MYDGEGGTSFEDVKAILGEPDSVSQKMCIRDSISNDLKKRGFKYVGPVIIYSYLQACGMINDHEKDCICYQRIKNTYPCITMDDGLL